jgi:hypothetical protein
MDPEDLREVLSSYQKCVAKTVRDDVGHVARQQPPLGNRINTTPSQLSAGRPHCGHAITSTL